MGVYEDGGVSEKENMMDKEKTREDGFRQFKRNKIVTSFQKNKAACLLIAALIVVIIGFALIPIIVRSRTSCNGNKIGIQKSAPCEDHWIWHQGKCYYFSTETKTWRNSEKFCKSHNSSLAIIENKEEKDFVFRYKGTDNHWIGIRRTDDNTAWTWTNGTLYNESLFRITRLSKNSGKMEYVFLNHEGVRSHEGLLEFKWICNRT
ncbi:C-type lectin domain family 2 member A-like [Anomaloglossus baeobatrachus]|uniref:C-type lectin domain family 2 member A-like n=1 Tax=Anomaloglossus baeobatrachus TaxID=238106 RepID=UPI003F506E77